MEKISYHGHSLRRWRVGPSTFLAWPEKGARLLNWNLSLADGSVRDVLHWPEDANWDDVPHVRGGNPILFPFCGRCFDRGEIFFWRDGAGVRRPMPIHGIARQSTFEVQSLDVRGFSARLIPSDESRACYPFEYDFTVTYRFEPAGLSCEFLLANRGAEPLPWSAGHHFYFTVPWAEGTTRQDYLLRIQAGRRLRQDAQGKIVPGPELKVDESLANPALSDTHHTELRSADAILGEPGKPGDIVVRNGTDKVPPPEAQFVTWSASPEVPYYCVEPWMGFPNPLETQRGLHWVKPGGTERFSVSVAVK